MITRIVLRRFNTDETGDQLSALLGENVSGEFAVAVIAKRKAIHFSSRKF